MKKSLLATAAAVALMTGPALAQKQEAPASKTESPAPAPKAMQHAPAEKMAPNGHAGGHAASKELKGSTTGQGSAGSHEQKAQERVAPQHRAQQPEHRGGTTGQATHEERTQKSESQRDHRGTAGEQSHDRNTQMQREPSRGSVNAQGKTDQKAGGSVSLTADQKTKIRTTVIESRSAPKIERSHINFSLNVGTVVPRSVKIVVVPPTLVEIHPAWRGYMYFVVGDELVIVEPRTLRIVAVVYV